MNIQVTSVSGTDQKLSQAAAAVFVITQEDIRRSGAKNIPDLLRIVPGLDVAQINANTWAVSARGFNHQFTDKLLVLVDGRAVYSPLLGGVNWDTQDVPLEDIDRIEVIRGPGATLWGANAVNGVINITTRKTADTKGGMIVAGGGSNGQANATAQYGGAIGGNTTYRVFTKYLNTEFAARGSSAGPVGRSRRLASLPRRLPGGHEAFHEGYSHLQGDLTPATRCDDCPYLLRRSTGYGKSQYAHGFIRRKYSRTMGAHFFGPLRHHSSGLF